MIFFFQKESHTKAACSDCGTPGKDKNLKKQESPRSNINRAIEETFAKLRKDVPIQIQEAHRTSNETRKELTTQSKH